MCQTDRKRVGGPLPSSSLLWAFWGLWRILSALLRGLSSAAAPRSAASHAGSLISASSLLRELSSWRGDRHTRGHRSTFDPRLLVEMNRVRMEQDNRAEARLGGRGGRGGVEPDGRVLVKESTLPAWFSRRRQSTAATAASRVVIQHPV